MGQVDLKEVHPLVLGTNTVRTRIKASSHHNHLRRHNKDAVSCCPLKGATQSGPVSGAAAALMLCVVRLGEKA